MKKRLLSTLLALCMALALLPGTARAADGYPTSGSCGENVTWYFDASTGTLTISGNGPMADYARTSDGDYVHLNSDADEVSWGSASLPWGEWIESFEIAWIRVLIITPGVTSVGSGAFSAVNSLTNVTIPNSVASIGMGAFSHCSSLTSVTIPSSVTSIGDFAFEGCNSLASVTIPNSVTSIGIGAFKNCSSLTNVAIPNSVTSIGDDIFWSCNSLTSVTIPNSVTRISGYAFRDCDSLTDVYYNGSEGQWKQISIGYNNPLANATIHYNSAGPDQGDSTPSNSTPGGNQDQETSSPNANEYIYNTPDPGEDMKLDTSSLNTVTDPTTAAEAVRDQVGGMTQEQKESPTGIDLATLYAETAVAKAASKPVSGPDILINAVNVAGLETKAAEALSAVENALDDGGIVTARELFKTVTFTTNATSQITIRIDPDVLGTEVDKVCVEMPDYALTFKLADLEADLTDSLTFKAAPANVETLSVKNAVDIEVPGGSMASSITVSLPTDKNMATTYQVVVSSTGTTAASKYNPATTDIDGKVNASGTYSVDTNEMDFTDITNKSTEMQKAIKYLAAHGIVMGSGGTNYSPNDSISRAELTALVLRALGKVDSKATPTFTDVTQANWYYATAASSQKLGYITGFEDNTFRGTTTINKEQIVVVAARVLGGEMNYKTPSNIATYLSKYSDTVVSWAQPQVALATRENLVVYRTDGTFSGAKNMTRGDAAIIIYRLFQRIW